MERASRNDLRPITTTGVAAFGESLSERLLGQRIVVLGQEVDDEVSTVLCSQLLLLAAEDPRRDIQLFINSPGGSISAGMAIYDTMQSIEPDVATVAQGTAASMGQFLLCAGAAGKRSALAHSKIMMHQPGGGLGGTASDVRIRSEQITRQKREMAELIAAHTGQTVEQVVADSDRDRWFTPTEAIEYGLIDRVVSRAGR
ncbi:ATP-dependent Clp protease proteolytic subunit [Pseudonocardia sp. KRD291]|uniref:ATP-dependent Clp protease proteolytic subunit n=1 Tax=Pseudonocardia sp. KRD291 TaxID=2792007 RepID=UPI001C4A011C|nr:ATP-dependent Clp protease proteolytic subunit [Pseudonocardia sp. KRD291]MBW0106067.1 ATP-dependent Clp protease proteolytic subunit [Pseudonocardia sp. KRD291]